MNKMIVVLLAVALGLGGCATPPHLLAVSAESSLIGGQFVHEAPTRLTLESAGKRYEANGFGIKKMQDWDVLRKAYQGTNPNHWNRIISGIDNDHVVYSAEPIAVASAGDELRCLILWSNGTAPRGTCTDKSNHQLTVKFD